MNRRTTLRSIDPPVSSRSPATPPPPPQPSGRSTSPYLIGGLVVVGLVLTSILAFLGTTSAGQSAPEPTAVPSTVVAPTVAPRDTSAIAPAAPACPSITS